MGIELTPIPDGAGSGVLVQGDSAEFWRQQQEHLDDYRRRFRAAVRARFEAMDGVELIELLTDVAEAVDSLETTVASHPQDWGAYKRDSWIFGIVCGWSSDQPDEDDDDAMSEQAEQHGWDQSTVNRLLRYENAIARLTEHEYLWPDRRHDRSSSGEQPPSPPLGTAGSGGGTIEGSG